MTVGVLFIVAGCTSSASPDLASPTAPGTAAQPSPDPALAEVRRLVEPTGATLTDGQVRCIKTGVLDNPTNSAIAHRFAKASTEQRQVVMTQYLQCAPDYFINTFLDEASRPLTPTETNCARAQLQGIGPKALAAIISRDPSFDTTLSTLMATCRIVGLGLDNSDPSTTTTEE